MDTPIRTPAPKRKPYQRPAVIHEARLEVRAGSTLGKIPSFLTDPGQMPKK